MTIVEPPTSPEREPFAYQAAKVAFWAPIIAILLGMATQSVMQQSPSSAFVIAGVNGLFLLTGFMMSIIALIGVFKYGPSGLLACGLFGMILSGLMLLVSGYFVFLIFQPSDHLEEKLPGNWQYIDSRFVTRNLTLQPNKHFEMHFVSASGEGQASGNWHVALNRSDSHFYLILHVDSASEKVHQMENSTLGEQIVDVKEDHLTVIDTGQTETYLRMPNSSPSNPNTPNLGG